MNCSVCGGVLHYKEGLYICQSCGNTISVSSYFEKTDVFIAYIETDDMGRRTKDSIIAGEIYDKLSALGVHIFYQQISADNLTGNEYEQAIQKSFDKSKIVLLLGTTKDNFDKLILKYSQFLNDKYVIPIYSQIDVRSLPKTISTIQALNYDSIGMKSVMIKIITEKLGIKSEVDIANVLSEKERYRKTRRFIILSILFGVILAFTCYIIFGTHYVLDVKKYDYAQSLEENGDYLSALDVYNSIKDYRDSNEKINNIYDKYNGFFSDDKETINLYLNIDNDLNASIQVDRVIDDTYVSLTTSTVVTKNLINFEFEDSLKNRGKGHIELLNSGIKLDIYMDDSDDLSIEKVNEIFGFTDRTDAPMIRAISVDTVLSWLKNDTKYTDLVRQNIDLESICSLDLDGLYLYELKNTDYLVLFDNLENMSVVGVYAPHNDLFPHKEFNFEPMITENMIYLPAKIHLSGVTNLVYQLGGLEKDYDDSLYFITSQNRILNTYENDIGVLVWESLINSIEQFKSYNLAEGIKYHLEISPDNGNNTQTGNFEILSQAIDEAKKRKNENYIVVDNNEKVIYIP